ncbi:MAG: hypothetical protein P4N59_33655 [Negativicutes bacterium]|nr:hypothetical protein [Negativicutes bacterium]
MSQDDLFIRLQEFRLRVQELESDPDEAAGMIADYWASISFTPPAAQQSN